VGIVRRIGGVWRSTNEYNWVVEWFSSVGSQNSSSEVSGRKKMAVCQWFVNSCNQLYNSPIISIIESKTRLICHENPGYVTVCSLSAGIKTKEWNWLILELFIDEFSAVYFT
jgi:hypothetical protein